MADLFDTPYSEVLSQGIQLLQNTMRARQTLQLQREKFEQDKKEHDDKVRLEEEKLKIERETLDLKTQAAAAKAAGEGAPNAAMINTMREGTKERAVGVTAQLLPPELQQYATWTESDISRAEQTASAKLQTLTTSDPYAQAVQDDLNAQFNMPAGKNHPKGPIGAQEKTLADLQNYRQYLHSTYAMLLRQHSFRPQMEGESPTPPAGAAAAPTALPELPPVVNATQAMTRLDAVLAGAKKTGQFVEPAGLGELVAQTSRDLVAAGNPGAVYDVFAKLRTAGVPGTTIDKYAATMLKKIGTPAPAPKQPKEL